MRFYFLPSSVSESKLTSRLFPNLSPHFLGVVLVVLDRDERFFGGVVVVDAAVVEREFGGSDERLTSVVVQ